MSLQLADFNADGHQDIVTAVWEGTVYMLPGSAKGFGEPQYVKDANDNLILLSRWYDMKERAYKSEDPKKPTEHLISAISWDWDADGDLDLILGAKDGQLYLRKNHGQGSQHKFAAENIALTAGGKPLSVPGGSTAPKTVDWDGDGLMDLVCGSFKGGVYWYRNVGQKGAPAFAAPVTLLKARKATADTSAPEIGCYVEPTDYDGDGDLDLVVGGYFMKQPKKRQLTAEEKARLKEIDRELFEKSKAWSELYAPVAAATKGMERKEAAKLRSEFYAREDVRAINLARSKLSRERMQLAPRPRRMSGVWLFRRANDPAPMTQESRR